MLEQLEKIVYLTEEDRPKQVEILVTELVPPLSGGEYVYYRGATEDRSYIFIHSQAYNEFEKMCRKTMIQAYNESGIIYGNFLGIPVRIDEYYAGRVLARIFLAALPKSKIDKMLDGMFLA